MVTLVALVGGLGSACQVVHGSGEYGEEVRSSGDTGMKFINHQGSTLIKKREDIQPRQRQPC